MHTKRKKYTREFKTEAVRLLTGSNMTIAQASQDLGVNANVLARWKKEFLKDSSQAFPGIGHVKPEEEEEEDELRRLRRENAILRQERDILKKAAAFFAKESQ